MIQYQLQLDEQGPDIDAYCVKVSARARSVSLAVLPDIGLQVTVPKRFKHSDIPAIVRENRDWVERAFAALQRDNQGRCDSWPPASLDLVAIDQRISVIFEALPEGSDRCSGELQADRMTLRTPRAQTVRVDTVSGLIAALLKRKARQYLEPLLALHAKEHAMVYRKLTVRGQKTLWGSCSSTGTISLNYKLLFLPPQLVDYVVLHELAHTRHMNHSPAFWNLLETMIPGARELDHQLDTEKFVPRWL